MKFPVERTEYCRLGEREGGETFPAQAVGIAPNDIFFDWWPLFRFICCGASLNATFSADSPIAAAGESIRCCGSSCDGDVRPNEAVGEGGGRKLP